MSDIEEVVAIIDRLKRARNTTRFIEAMAELMVWRRKQEDKAHKQKKELEKL